MKEKRSSGKKVIFANGRISKNVYTIADNRYNSILRRSGEGQLKMILFIKLIMKKDFNDNIIRYVDCKIPDEYIKKYKDLYKNMRDIRDRNKKIKKWVKDHKCEIKKFKKTYKEVFEKNQISKNNFRNIYGNNNEKDKRKCHYCGISEAQIEKLADKSKIKTKRFYSRGKTMEIDQLDPEDGYNKDNIVLACYWCNNAKTDEFDEDEFKPIAKQIKKIWNKRLKKKRSKRKNKRK